MNVKLSNTKFIKTAPFKVSNNLSRHIDFSLNKNKLDLKVIGNFKHIIPNNKEWSNSIYSYNRNYLADIAIKNKLVTKSISNYINMAIFQKTKNESGLKLYRIMRKQIRITRKSLKSIIIAKPEIKYTNDKAIITLYFLDKEKESILRKTLFFARSFKLNKTLKLYLKELTKEKTQLFHNSKYNMINEKYDKFTIQQNFKLKKTSNSISKNRFAENINDYIIHKKKLIISLVKKKHFFKNAFFFMFLKWTLLLLMIKISIINSKNNKFILLVNSINNNKSMFHVKNDLFLPKLEKINNILLSILLKTITNHKKNFHNIISKEKMISFLFIYYKNKYLTKFINRYLKKQTLFLYQIYKLSINNFRYSKFIPGIKLVADKIFDKKIELNIVNLKYLHLNSTILVKSIATRLKRKTTQLLLVLKRSLKLVKLPIKLDLLSSKYRKSNIENFTSLDILNSYKDINVNLLTNFKNNNKISDKKPTRDILNNTLVNIFSFLNRNLWWNFLNKVNVNNFNQHNILNSIKHKWVKGVRIETKGRLTKRYTASRSVFKFKYKGNLRDLSSSGNISSSMSRGYVKSNIIYTYIGSKRRIGAFGIKGWISTY